VAREFDFPLVVDPVMISKHGAELMVEDARRAVAEKLLPRAYLLTPNMAEASALAGYEVEDLPAMRRAARELSRMGAHAVLVKGGHLRESATDVLYADGEWHEFTAPRIPTTHTHGTGCTYSAAITAELARGTALLEAIRGAKAFMTEAIRTHPGLGRGSGPVNHHARLV
jgi:hydroxymethylpyrimidine/phosphomethylpyrimidine kinase